MSTDEVQQAVADGVVEGARRLAGDPQFAEVFWRTGFEHLARHSGNHASQWIGKRLLTSLIVAITTAGLIWLAKSGGIK